MAHNQFLNQGVEIVRNAIAKDNNKEYEAAYQGYQAALDRFVLALKYEKNPSTKKILTARVSGYMSRAEELKALLDNKNKPQEAAPVGATNGGGGEGKNEGNKEMDKLKAKLSSIMLSKKPNVSWDDVAGLEVAKTALKEAVILPAKFPQLFTGKRRPWKGILLYGPPGTGKSYLATALATEAKSKFFSVSSSDLVSKWQGESEKLVKGMFQMAREQRPCIIFVDEIDSLCSARGEGENEASRRIKTEFLVQMQGVGKTHDGLLVLGATNVPWEIDAAMRRRFEKRVYIPLPEAYARAYMFNVHLGDTPNNLQPFSREIDPSDPEGSKYICTSPDFCELAAGCEGFSGSDISVVVREALMEPVRRCQRAKYFVQGSDGNFSPCISSTPGAKQMSLYDIPGSQLSVPVTSMDDFRHCMAHVNGSVAEGELTRFIEWTAEFGEEGA